MKFIGNGVAFFSNEGLFLDSESSDLLSPWPIDHRMLPIFMNFVPFAFKGCCIPESRFCGDVNRVVFRANTHAHCGVHYTDTNLVQQCRAKWEASKDRVALRLEREQAKFGPGFALSF